MDISFGHKTTGGIDGEFTPYLDAFSSPAEITRFSFADETILLQLGKWQNRESIVKLANIDVLGGNARYSPQFLTGLPRFG